MSRIVKVMLVGALLMSLAVPALADQSKDAQALVDSALAMVKEKGLDATLAAIADKNGPFVKGDLYIFAGDMEKVANVAHPINPKLVGKSFSAIKDVKGKLFYQDFVNTAKLNGTGWVEYWWPKPGAKEASAKVTYIARVPDTNIFFACGFYK